MSAFTARAAAAAILLALAACGGPPWTLSQSPSEITLRWYPDDTPDAAADAAAQVHCRSSGKDAEFVSYTRDGSAKLGTYRCR
jgi:hypothetical protein